MHWSAPCPWRFGPYAGGDVLAGNADPDRATVGRAGSAGDDVRHWTPAWRDANRDLRIVVTTDDPAEVAPLQTAGADAVVVVDDGAAGPLVAQVLAEYGRAEAATAPAFSSVLVGGTDPVESACTHLDLIRGVVPRDRCAETTTTATSAPAPPAGAGIASRARRPGTPTAGFSRQRPGSSVRRWCLRRR